MAVIDFNTLLQQASTSFDPLPDGPYDFIVAEATATQSSTGKAMWKVKFKVETGPHAGKSVFNNFTLSVESGDALAFFFQDMSALGLDKAFFAQNPNPEAVASALVGRRARAEIGHKEWQGRQQNTMKKLMPAAGMAGMPMPQATMPMPMQVPTSVAPVQPVLTPVPPMTPVPEMPPVPAPAPMFDPNTGQPIAPVAPQQPVVQQAAYEATGGIQQAPAFAPAQAPAPAPIGYDPRTGQPIYAAAAPAPVQVPPVQYDPNTGQPIQAAPAPVAAQPTAPPPPLPF